MELEDGHIITLEDNKDYMVVKKIRHNGINYVYLMTATKPIQVSIVKEEYVNNEIVLTPIEDDNELESVIDLFGIKNN